MSLTLAALGLLTLHLLAAALAASHGRRRAPAPSHRPFICLLRPVCGRDRHDRETLGSSFGLDWPDYEIVFCAAHEEDAAVPLVRELIRLHPGARARLLIGEDCLTANPKLNNLAKGWAGTEARMIAIADANLMLPRDYLEQLMSEWRPGVGLVSSPPAGGRAEGIWGALEASFLNGLQGRWQLAAARVGLGFAQGKTMFLDRSLLDERGGLAALGAELAEDVAATRLVRAAGRSVRLVPRPFTQPIGRRRLRDVWDRQLRWSRIRRKGFPALFALEPLLSPVVPLVMLGVAAPLSILPFLALWYGAETALCRAMGWPHGRRDLAAWVARDLMLPVLWVATFARQGFEWRGTSMSPAAGKPAA
ncbi:glycosyltransferase [Cereibacter azotoformans]|uniref:Ceramide glucosyltransferase. Glycoside Hydrolase family 21 n=1 Tax=Cereibacter sphaeroides (strain ATCC 17025 / ATH 2.4.3) TaxID=349102 RepID=A4WQR2_CERS5|nr:glycosyltransferase [Cereibacter azotoformans]ULB09043.1 glycosyltransferase [Cereibacter azotoformans]